METNLLSIQICNSIEEAPKYGREYKVASLEKTVIVKNGTVEGNPTVDLIFTDDQGRKYVAMITGRLLKMVTTAIGGTNEGMQ